MFHSSTRCCYIRRLAVRVLATAVFYSSADHALMTMLIFTAVLFGASMTAHSSYV
jgi:hypothetical protein